MPAGGSGHRAADRREQRGHGRRIRRESLAHRIVTVENVMVMMTAPGTRSPSR